MTSDRRDAVAIILAVGLSVALIMLMTGVLWDAVRSDTPGISENATQIITGAFGGIVGVLGSFVGYKAGEKHAADTARDAASEEPPQK